MTTPLVFQRILLSRTGAVATITLNRPPANPIDTATLREIGMALGSVEADRGVGAVIITGAGDRMFSAGADVPRS